MPAVPTVLTPFTFRLYRGDEDIPAILAVHDACRERDATDPHSVCYSLPNLLPYDYVRRLGSIPADTILLAEVAGTVVAHAWMEVWGIEERLYLWHVWVVPSWRGHGLGTAMNRLGEAKAREMHGDDVRVGLHLANATDGEQDAVALLLSEGHHLSFVSPELAFDAFEAVPPVLSVPAIALRALEPSEHRAVARALCEANLNPPDHEHRWVRPWSVGSTPRRRSGWNTSRAPILYSVPSAGTAVRSLGRTYAAALGGWARSHRWRCVRRGVAVESPEHSPYRASTVCGRRGA